MNNPRCHLLKSMFKYVGFHALRKDSTIIAPLVLPSLHLRNSYSTNSDVKPVKLVYNVHDSTSKLEKSPIVIMHGLFGSKTNWQSLGKVINQKTERKVIVVDARNHGDSPHTPEMSYRHLASDVIQLLNDLKFEKAVLLGHSMGGSAMMFTALNYPKIVEKLIVVDMSPIRTSPALSEMNTIFQAMRSVKFDKSLSVVQMRKSANEQLSQSISSAMLRQVIQFLLTNMVESNTEGYKWRINLPVLERNFLSNIATFPNVEKKTFTGSTLFIGGAESDYIQRKDHEAIKKLFPAALFTYIDDAHHWLHVEKPQEFLAIATEFINQ